MFDFDGEFGAIRREKKEEEVGEGRVCGAEGSVGLVGRVSGKTM